MIRFDHEQNDNQSRYVWCIHETLGYVQCEHRLDYHIKVNLESWKIFQSHEEVVGAKKSHYLQPRVHDIQLLQKNGKQCVAF